jgi:hypothetical protein
MVGSQSRLSHIQFIPTRRAYWFVFLRALHPDELGAGGTGAATMFFQPVGVDQPRRVVVRSLADRLQKRLVVSHRRHLDRRYFADNLPGQYRR